eukprot:UN02303
MLKFIMKRIFEAIPTMLVSITISSFSCVSHGNPFSSERPLPPEVMANIEAKYGLDKPVFEQYTTYLTNIIQGDFGPSFKYQDYTVNEFDRGCTSSICEGRFRCLYLHTIDGGHRRDDCRLEAQYLGRLHHNVDRHARGG